MPKCNASNADQFSFQHNVNDDQYLIFTAGIIFWPQAGFLSSKWYQYSVTSLP